MPHKAEDASAKLGAEANQIGMTGILGGVERLGCTTYDGLKHIPAGLEHVWENTKAHPEDLVKTFTGALALGVTLKTILPEAGPVGKIASLGMATYFGYETVPKFFDAYKTGINANTWAQMHESGAKWGDTASQLGVDIGVGYVGYKIGSGLTGRALAAERFDGFADAKQNFWNKSLDLSKKALRMDTTIPTASSVGLRPNFVVDGDKAVLLDSIKETPSGEIIGKTDGSSEMNATVMLRGKASVLRMDRYLARMSRGRAEVLGDENDAFAKRFGASPESLAAVKDFAKQYQLEVAESDLRSGRVLLKGKTADFQKAFTISLNNYATEGGMHMGHEGPVSLPKELMTHVRAVLGTDERPAVKATNRTLYKMDDSGNLLNRDGTPVAKEAPPASAGATSASADAPATTKAANGITDATTPPTTSGNSAAPAGEVDNASFIKKGGYRAIDIARAQNFPLRTGGEGQSGAFISLSGGVDLADYNKFFADHGLEQPRPLGILEVDGAKNSRQNPGGGLTEDLLDAVQMQSIAPRAQIDMILGPNSDQGLVDVFERGIFPKGDEAQKSVISASWGLAEGEQTPQAINTLSISFRQGAIRGVQVLAGAGDNGAKANSPNFQPEYPGSDPNVISVGGLKTILNEDGSFSYVTAWDEGEHSSTGGGVSKLFKLPFWQRGIGVPNNLDTGKPGRGVPDISTNAAKATGFPVRVNGENYVIGGTSAGAPLYGGMLLNINAELAAIGIKPVTPLNPWMYARANTNIFNDIATGGNHGYEAGKGWDAVTGLGWVNGQHMVDAMKVNQTVNVPSRFRFLPKPVLLPGEKQAVAAGQ